MSVQRIHPLYTAMRRASRPPRAPDLRALRDLSRRDFLRVTGGSAAALLAAGVVTPARADGGVAPVPIPETILGPFGPIHFLFPGPADLGNEPSLITDFNGFIGVADLILSGTGTDLTTNTSAPYQFHTDWRFMQGVYVGVDGRVHQGTFSFI